MIDELNSGLEAKGKLLDPYKSKRVLQSEINASKENASTGRGSSQFDLMEFLQFEIERGADNSAPVQNMTFSVNSTEVSGSNLHFKAIFDNPLEISKGSAKDVLIITSKNAAFFANVETGATIETGT